MKNTINRTVDIISSRRIPLTICLYLTNLNYLDGDWGEENELCNFTKFFYIIDGKISMTIDGEQLVAEAGDLLIIPAGSTHSYSLVDKKPAALYFADTMVHFSNKELRDVLVIPYKSHIGLKEETINVFKELSRTKNDFNIWSTSIYHSNLITSLFLNFINHCDAEIRFKDEIDNALNTAVEYINEHYTEKISIEELARKSFLSTNRFINKFENVIGMSPKQYISILRLKKAEGLLKSTSMTLQEISESLGYYDTAHFCKIFKDFSGFTPTKYRKLAKESSISINRKKTTPL